MGRAFCGFPVSFLTRWPLRACCYRRGSAEAARSRATDPAATRAEPAAILGLRSCTARASLEGPDPPICRHAEATPATTRAALIDQHSTNGRQRDIAKQVDKQARAALAKSKANHLARVWHDARRQRGSPSAPSATRTRDPLLRRQVLYPLSYRGLAEPQAYPWTGAAAAPPPVISRSDQPQ